MAYCEPVVLAQNSKQGMYAAASCGSGGAGCKCSQGCGNAH
ncbi:hypothetical protein R84B8_01377 [Treponema sp. R8-4-B8]